MSRGTAESVRRLSRLNGCVLGSESGCSIEVGLREIVSVKRVLRSPKVHSGKLPAPAQRRGARATARCLVQLQCTERR